MLRSAGGMPGRAGRGEQENSLLNDGARLLDSEGSRGEKKGEPSLGNSNEGWLRSCW